MEWIPCDEDLPKGENCEIPCLVTCQEWDIFESRWKKSEIRVVSYSTKFNQWNTKSDIRIIAWMYLPSPYNKE